MHIVSEATDLIPTSTPAPSLREVSTVIDGKYRIDRLIARGGCAEVFAATHMFTGRVVALKLPKSSATPEMHARLRAEMVLLEQVRSPGVVELLDAGSVRGAPYLVLEHLEGRTLEGILAARGALPPRGVLRIGLALARVLATCHERGVVHRDVKPSNVILTIHDELKLIDFNIARAVEATQARATAVGMLVGTPDYMPIEALVGGPDSAQRADVFAFGVTLYELLTGRLPFSSDDLPARARGSFLPLVEQVPEVSAELAAVVERCLAPSPEGRWASLREVARELSHAAAAHAQVDGRGARASGGAHDVADALSRLQESRRRHARAPYLTPGRIQLGDGAKLDVRIEEISAGGCLFLAQRPLPAGTELTLKFALPAGRVVAIAAEVRWCRAGRASHAVGVEFRDCPFEVAEALGRYASIIRPSAAEARAG
jgi:serine/threonine protein kinase